MGELGGLLITGAIAVFVCGDAQQWWPYCLGAFLAGLLLIILDRTLPNRER